MTGHTFVVGVSNVEYVASLGVREPHPIPPDRESGNSGQVRDVDKFCDDRPNRTVDFEAMELRLPVRGVTLRVARFA